MGILSGGRGGAVGCRETRDGSWEGLLGIMVFLEFFPVIQLGVSSDVMGLFFVGYFGVSELILQIFGFRNLF